MALLTAQKALNDLQVKTEEVNRQTYSVSIHAAGAAVQVGNTTEARRRLNDCPEELRGWDWGHLDLACDLSLQKLEGHESSVRSVVWNPAGTRIVSGSDDKTLRIWDAATGTTLQTLEGHESGVTSVAWNSAGTRIVSGSWDKTLRIWDAATGTSLQTLEGHENEVYSVAWNPAGTRIVSGSRDKTLRIWDAATGTSLQTLKGHEGPVYSVAWNPAGTRIVSGSRDGTTRIWESRLEDALPMWRAVEQRRLVDSLNHLGPLLRAQGKYDEAEALFHEALEGSRRQLGDDHPNTLKIEQSLDALLKEKQESESPPPDPPSDGNDGDHP